MQKPLKIYCLVRNYFATHRFPHHSKTFKSTCLRRVVSTNHKAARDTYVYRWRCRPSKPPHTARRSTVHHKRKPERRRWTPCKFHRCYRKTRIYPHTEDSCTADPALGSWPCNPTGIHMLASHGRALPCNKRQDAWYSFLVNTPCKNDCSNLALRTGYDRSRTVYLQYWWRKKNKKYEQIGNNNECRLPDTKLSGIWFNSSLKMNGNHKHRNILIPLSVT